MCERGIFGLHLAATAVGYLKLHRAAVGASQHRRPFLVLNMVQAGNLRHVHQKAAAYQHEMRALQPFLKERQLAGAVVSLSVGHKQGAEIVLTFYIQDVVCINPEQAFSGFKEQGTVVVCRCRHCRLLCEPVFPFPKAISKRRSPFHYCLHRNRGSAKPMQHISRKRLTPKDASLSLAYSRCIQNFADSDSGNKSVKLNFSLCRYVSRCFFLSDAYIYMYV